MDIGCSADTEDGRESIDAGPPAAAAGGNSCGGGVGEKGRPHRGPPITGPDAAASAATARPPSPPYLAAASAARTSPPPNRSSAAERARDCRARVEESPPPRRAAATAAVLAASACRSNAYARAVWAHPSGGDPAAPDASRRAGHRRTASLSVPPPAEGATSDRAARGMVGAAGLRGGVVERSGPGAPASWTRAALPRPCRRPHRRRRAAPRVRRRPHGALGRARAPRLAPCRRGSGSTPTAGPATPAPCRPSRQGRLPAGATPSRPRAPRRSRSRVPLRAAVVGGGEARAGGAAATPCRARNAPGGREERRTAGAERRRAAAAVAVGHGRQPQVDRANARIGKHVGRDGGARRGGGPTGGTAPDVTGARVLAGNGNGGRDCRGGGGTAAAAPSRLKPASTLRRIGKTARAAAAVDARVATFPEL